MSNLIYDSITPNASNALMGLAMGDMFGSTFECLGLSGNLFLLNGIADLPDHPPVGSFTTDDTFMAVTLLNNVISGWDAASYHAALAEWSGTELAAYQGIGTHTSMVLNHGYEGTSQGNGCLMAILPAAIFLIDNGYSQEELTQWMYEVQAVTQHEANVEAALFLLGYDVEVNIQQGDSAWVANSLGAVTDALNNASSMVEGFQQIVSIGGDTDTNAAIYGAIYSYQNGLEQDPFAGSWSIPASSGVFQV